MWNSKYILPLSSATLSSASELTACAHVTWAKLVSSQLPRLIGMISAKTNIHNMFTLNFWY